jgi:hypothetical protein
METKKMGLDNVWSVPEGREAPIFCPPLRLCGGLLSDPDPSEGVGDISFRGKVYYELFWDEFRVSLYDNLDPKVIKGIAQGLIGLHPRHDELVAKYHREVHELQDLDRMFRSYALVDASLMARG